MQHPRIVRLLVSSLLWDAAATMTDKTDPNSQISVLAKTLGMQPCDLRPKMVVSDDHQTPKGIHLRGRSGHRIVTLIEQYGDYVFERIITGQWSQTRFKSPHADNWPSSYKEEKRNRIRSNPDDIDDFADHYLMRLKKYDLFEDTSDGVGLRDMMADAFECSIMAGIHKAAENHDVVDRLTVERFSRYRAMTADLHEAGVPLHLSHLVVQETVRRNIDALRYLSVASRSGTDEMEGIVNELTNFDRIESLLDDIDDPDFADAFSVRALQSAMQTSLEVAIAADANALHWSPDSESYVGDGTHSQAVHNNALKAGLPIPLIHHSSALAMISVLKRQYGRTYGPKVSAAIAQNDSFIDLPRFPKAA